MRLIWEVRQKRKLVSSLELGLIWERSGGALMPRAPQLVKVCSPQYAATRGALMRNE
ncbi:MAG: hypothetical protein GF311_09815 [Candidatus Lokiarchaeota archaeon]|nr:hypothetical protein [Candidatus Lokiarchaeota archaeon]